MTTIISQCFICKQLDPGSKKKPGTCKAFPQRIPDEIWNNEHDHDNPFPGDSGIRFEEVEEW